MHDELNINLHLQHPVSHAQRKIQIEHIYMQKKSIYKINVIIEDGSQSKSPRTPKERNGITVDRYCSSERNNDSKIVKYR